MKGNLEQLLACLKLRKVAEIYDRDLAKSEKSGEPFSQGNRLALAQESCGCLRNCRKSLKG